MLDPKAFLHSSLLLEDTSQCTTYCICTGNNCVPVKAINKTVHYQDTYFCICHHRRIAFLAHTFSVAYGDLLIGQTTFKM